jgi:thiopeptide-type bacteriocin biosynthesis protein
MTPLRLEDWIYLKLYTGQAYEKLDHLIIDVASRLSTAGGIERWFFLRYVDEGGVHLRVRARAAAGGAAALRPRLARLCDEALERLPQYPPPFYRPMTLSTAGAGLDQVMPPATGRVKLAIAVYEPELDKFGGEACMGLAEELFERSSLVACAVLKGERDGLWSRKSLAPSLMDAAREAFSPGDAAAFWRDYSLFWLGGASGAADDWRARFADKASELRSRGIEVVPPVEELPPAARELLVDWRGRLARTAAAYELAWPSRHAQTLAANFIHLTNNRLGLAGLEEAYTAALLEQSAPAELAA